MSFLTPKFKEILQILKNKKHHQEYGQWTVLINSLEQFSDDFMLDREQPKEQQRRNYYFK